MQFRYWEQLQESLYNNVMVSGAQSSLTPYT
jgi:hypothetical protein